MDFSSLKDQVSNLTLYDLKAGVRKVQNAVMNYTEMEAKVREATNNEPWGASSTIMQEIANGTYSYQLLNEIMPMIYKRFTEKSAEEWRQIYKSLQLLEFLIKNGSERVIDDARSHLSLLKMLRQFQYFDQNGKDQGINVRNRAKELSDLLSDVDKIRAERKKAKSNRNKFGGVEGGAGLGSGMGGSSSRYGGFGSEDAGYGGYNGGVYGDGGGFGGQESSIAAAGGGGRRDKFEEYDEGDDVQATTSTSRHTRNTSTASAGKKKAEESKPKAPEIDLFEFGDEMPALAPPQSAGMRSNATDDDDFDDFISATPAPTSNAATISNIMSPPQTTNTISTNTTFAAPRPVAATQASSLSGLTNFTSISPAPSAQSSVSASTSTFSSFIPRQSNQFSQPMQPVQSQPPKPMGYQAAQPNYFTSVQAQPQGSTGGGIARPGISNNNPTTVAKPAASKPAGGADAFSNLWSTASSSAGIAKKTPVQGPNLASLAKEKTSAGIWGAASKPAQPSANMGGFVQQRPQQPSASQPNQATSGGLDDLLG